MQHAKRGDLVIIERRTSYTMTTETGSSTVYDVGMVTSITRDGVVKAYQPCDSDRSQTIERTFGFRRCYVQPKDSIDVQKALSVARAHQWPNRETRSYDHTMPFASLDEVRASLAEALS